MRGRVSSAGQPRRVGGELSHSSQNKCGCDQRPPEDVCGTAALAARPPSNSSPRRPHGRGTAVGGAGEVGLGPAHPMVGWSIHFCSVCGVGVSLTSRMHLKKSGSFGARANTKGSIVLV